MARVERILVPVDFSSCALEAFRRALAFGQPFDARYELLHVWTAPTYVPPTLAIQIAQSHDTTTLEAMARAEATEQMGKFLAKLEIPAGTSVTTRIEAGEALDVILARSKEHDLIVAGTHGRTGMSHLLLGSVAEKLVRLSDKPVLTVRAQNGHGEGAPKKVLGPLAPPRTVLVSVDFSSCSKLALRQAIVLCERFDARLDIIHAVTHVPVEGAELLVTGYAGESKTPFREWARARADEEMASFLADLPPVKRGETRVLLGEPVDTILDVANVDGYDLIVIGTHGRTGMSRLIMGSVAERIVRRAPCPVLTVREPQTAGAS